METILGVLIASAAVLVISIPAALWWAFAASYLWEWFIVSKFHAPPLTVLEMWGIFVTIAAIHPTAPQIWKPKDDSDETGMAALFYVFTGPPISRAVGYFIKFVLMA